MGSKDKKYVDEYVGTALEWSSSKQASCSMKFS